MMTVPMDNSSAPPVRELSSHPFKKNIELKNGSRKSAQLKIPSDPNAWLQMRENYESKILEDHDFSGKHDIENDLWQLHYGKIKEFRAHIKSAATSGGSITSQDGKSLVGPDRIKKIHSVFISFLSEASGFYHDLILKIKAKYGLPLGYFSEAPENQIILAKDEKKSIEMKKGLVSYHRCLIYLGDLARYKEFYGEGDSVCRDYAVASSYYIQAASLWPSSGNPHHQLAILALYSGDELVTIYWCFRSLAVYSPVSAARDNLIIAFEKNRQTYSQLLSKAKVPSFNTSPVQVTGRGRGRGDTRLLAKETKAESIPTVEREPSIPEIFKAFSVRFVRLNGILFTRTSLETFGELLSLVISDLYELLSSGPEEQLNFGQDAAAESGLVILRLIAMLIFTVHNVNRESNGQSYAEILQHTVLHQNACTAAFEIAGHILKRCIQLNDAASSYLLPATLVFIEWLACHVDIAAGIDVDEKQGTSRSFFWIQCVSFLNKLMLSGLVSIDAEEDNSCFFNMDRYDEGETGNRLALWEDIELRGFSPLVPAQLILDFSRKHSIGSDGNNEKRARLQRILAAGRALMNVVRINNQEPYYDSNLKKFVIGKKPTTYEDHVPTSFSVASKSNNIKQTGPSGDTDVTQANSVNLKLTQSNAELFEEGEEEDEVIVFKPTFSKDYTNKSSASKLDAYENIQTVQNSSKVYGSELGDWTVYGGPVSAALNNVKLSTAPSATSQLHPSIPSISQLPYQHIGPSTSKSQDLFVTDRLKNLNIAENDLHANSGFQGGPSRLQLNASTPLFSETASPSMKSILSNQMNVESVIPSKIDSIVLSGAKPDGLAMKLSVALPASQKKNPVSRPVRHLGPPPGFSNATVKNVDSSISEIVVKDLDPQMDDYSWLDGYQMSSNKGMVKENSINHTADTFPQVTVCNINNSTSGMSFPFPGKQIPTVQTQVANAKWKNFELFEHPKLYSEQHLQQVNQQRAPLPEQYQAQSLWSTGYFE